MRWPARPPRRAPERWYAHPDVVSSRLDLSGQRHGKTRGMRRRYELLRITPFSSSKSERRRSNVPRTPHHQNGRIHGRAVVPLPNCLTGTYRHTIFSRSRPSTILATRPDHPDVRSWPHAAQIRSHRTIQRGWGMRPGIGGTRHLTVPISAGCTGSCRQSRRIHTAPAGRPHTRCAAAGRRCAASRHSDGRAYRSAPTLPPDAREVVCFVGIVYQIVELFGGHGPVTPIVGQPRILLGLSSQFGSTGACSL